jgi:hypothetical protein
MLYLSYVDGHISGSFCRYNLQFVSDQSYLSLHSSGRNTSIDIFEKKCITVTKRKKKERGGCELRTIRIDCRDEIFYKLPAERTKQATGWIC